MHFCKTEFSKCKSHWIFKENFKTMSRPREIPSNQTWKYITQKNIISWLVVYDSARDQRTAKIFFPFLTDRETVKQNERGLTEAAPKAITFMSPFMSSWQLD